MLLEILVQCSGLGWPGGRGLQTSKGSLKSRPFISVLSPLNIGSGNVLLMGPADASSGISARAFFSAAVARPSARVAGVGWPA